MSAYSEILIRDGVTDDIPVCIALDSSYETDIVWQMSVFEDIGERRITFKQDHLPRTLRTIYAVDHRRLQLALDPAHCFIVAVQRDNPQQLYAFLTMRYDPFHRMAIVQDIVVALNHRRRKIGTRLLNIARHWALEHEASQLILETQTKNYPAIAFCQKAGLPFCGYSDQHFLNQDIAVYFGQSLR